MGIITLTICSFLLGKELRNLAYKRNKVVIEQNENGININKIIWASLGFYVGILV